MRANYGNIVLDDNQSLTVIGSIQSPGNGLTLQVNSGDLDVAGTATLSANTMILRSSQGQVYGTGRILATGLKVNADTGIDLDGLNNDISIILETKTLSGPDVVNNNGGATSGADRAPETAALTFR